MNLFPRSFNRTLGTKRASGTGTRRGTPAAYLSEVRCSEFIPVDLEAKQESKVDQSGFSWDGDIFCDDADIVQEDVIFFDDGGETTEYFVVGLGRWPSLNLPGHVLQLRVRKYQGL